MNAVPYNILLLQQVLLVAMVVLWLLVVVQRRQQRRGMSLITRCRCTAHSWWRVCGRLSISLRTTFNAHRTVACTIRICTRLCVYVLLRVRVDIIGHL
eukprot:COSAG05_NODE_156_length_15696_cov_359.955440_10_plen_98_part_00